MAESYVFRKEELKLNPYIFRTNDIRGIFERDFDRNDCVTIGKACGTWMLEKGKDNVALGMDNRLSSPTIHEALIEGLISTGIKVLDLGQVATPVSYLAPILIKTGGSLMITASHQPSEWNGIKVSYEDRTIFGDEIQEIRKIGEQRSFKQGKGSVEKVEIDKPYKELLLKKIAEFEEILGKKKVRSKLKVVIDCANGMAGKYAPDLLRSIGCEVVELHTRLDGSFPNHGPDPTVGVNVLEAVSLVKREKADLGIMFDADSDRVNICDEKGFVLWGDGILMLFARDILTRDPRLEILYNTQCSPAVEEDIVMHKGIPVMVPTGHSLVLNELRFYEGAFAGEYKCHFYFYDHYYGFDDAFYAALRLIKILERKEMPLSEQMTDVPFYYATGEIEIPTPDDRKFHIAEQVKNSLRKRYFVNELDGARVKFKGLKDTWGLMRASGTTPKLEIFSWARDQKNMIEARDILMAEIKKYS
jgi:phosphomannomutase/phosphoglucomutase